MYGYKIKTDFQLLSNISSDIKYGNEVCCYKDDQIYLYRQYDLNNLIGTNKYNTIFSFFQNSGKFIMIKDMGCFYIEQNNIKYNITCDLFSDEAICTTLSTHILGHVMLKDCYLLHATTLLKNNQAICLLGYSGSGKSTLALKLLLDCGYSLVSDDMSVISKRGDVYYAAQGSPYTKIWLDTYNQFKNNDMITQMSLKNIYKNDGKKIIRLPNYISNKELYPLNRIIILDRQKDLFTGMRQLDTMESYVFLFENNYIKYACTEKEIMVQASMLSDIVSHVPVYLFSYKNGYEYLDENVSYIESLIN